MAHIEEIRNVSQNQMKIHWWIPPKYATEIYKICWAMVDKPLDKTCEVIETTQSPYGNTIISGLLPSTEYEFTMVRYTDSRNSNRIFCATTSGVKSFRE